MILSFIITIYNKKTYIEDCVREIVKIQSDEIEILLIDDGSDDGSIEICRKLSLEDKRVHFFSQKNQGVSKARNLGIKQAKGDYVSFVDCDDIIRPSAFEKFLDEPKDAELYCFDYQEQRNDKIIYVKRKFTHIGKVSLQEWREYLLSNETNAVWDNIYQRKLLLKYNILFPAGVKMGEDFIFNLHYTEHCVKIIYWDISNYVYRVNNQGSAMSSVNIAYIADYVQMDEELVEYYINMNPEIYKQWMEFFLNMVCKMLILWKQNISESILENFENSELYVRLINGKFSGIKLKFKSFFLRRKGYRVENYRKMLRTILYWRKG